MQPFLSRTWSPNHLVHCAGEPRAEVVDDGRDNSGCHWRQPGHRPCHRRNPGQARPAHGPDRQAARRRPAGRGRHQGAPEGRAHHLPAPGHQQAGQRGRLCHLGQAGAAPAVRAHQQRRWVLSSLQTCLSCSTGSRRLRSAAGFAFKGNVFGADEAQQTLDTNFLGTLDVCEALAPLMRRGGRIVNVCSLAGKERIIRKPELLQRFQAGLQAAVRLLRACTFMPAQLTWLVVCRRPAAMGS